MNRCTCIVTLMTICGIVVTPAIAGVGQTKTHLGGKPSEMVQLARVAVPSGTQEPALQVFSDGSADPFVLPDGTVFIATDLVVISSDAVTCRLLSPGGSWARIDVSLRESESSKHVSLGTGIVFAGAPLVRNVSPPGRSVTAHIYGYLAKDR